MDTAVGMARRDTAVGSAADTAIGSAALDTVALDTVALGTVALDTVALGTVVGSEPDMAVGLERDPEARASALGTAEGFVTGLAADLGNRAAYPLIGLLKYGDDAPGNVKGRV
jgi:sugar phosphate permease